MFSWWEKNWKRNRKQNKKIADSMYLSLFGCIMKTKCNRLYARPFPTPSPSPRPHAPIFPAPTSPSGRLNDSNCSGILFSLSSKGSDLLKLSSLGQLQGKLHSWACLMFLCLQMVNGNIVCDWSVCTYRVPTLLQIVRLLNGFLSLTGI